MFLSFGERRGCSRGMRMSGSLIPDTDLNWLPLGSEYAMFFDAGYQTSRPAKSDVGDR